MAEPRILYVEDEPFLAKIVSESLESRGYAVKLVTDGARAVAAFAEWQPDICVLDVMLPGQSGFEIAEEIRRRDPAVPILFVTAKTQTEDVLQGFRVGGNDYIRKPFSLEELIVRLENMLQLTRQRATGSTPGDDDWMQLGDYRFSVTRLELIYRDEEPESLSYREVQILDQLCRHRNGTLERQKLLLAVWDDDSFFNSRNLDVYIRKLRRYLERDARVKIVTLKGVGYRFMVDED
ncbi:MAG: response regulator transcription factor [Lewinella sp.]|nr:response regulator transcription factor [Lewinella sp.]